MTCKTILRRRLQIRNGARIKMTFRASSFGVFAIQLKREGGMVEIFPKPIHTVVTRKAIRPKRQDMCLGKNNIHLTMATVTGLR